MRTAESSQQAGGREWIGLHLKWESLRKDKSKDKEGEVR